MRRTPLKRTSGLARSGRLKPMSDKKVAGIDARAEIREEVFKRDGRKCLFSGYVESFLSFPESPADLVVELEGCLLIGLRCFGELSVHHVIKSSAGGPYRADNLITLCHRHNGFAEEHPALAAAMGLVVRR